MNTFHPSIDSSPSCLTDWLTEAVGLVQRVNARLCRDPRPTEASRHRRQVLSDLRCLELAGLALPDVTV
jgi:hypothetical protein